MTTYALTLNLTQQNIADLPPGSRICISKTPGGQNSPGTTVIWLSWAPWETNTVTWQEFYSVYASNTLIENGATISVSSSLANPPAVLGDLYTFTNNTFNDGAPYPQQPTAYSILNSNGETSTFGLMQLATVNGGAQTSVLNAISLPQAFTASFTPEITLGVWIQTSTNNGYVITNIVGPVTTMNFTANTSLTSVWDESTASFLPPTPTFNLKYAKKA